MVPLGVAQQLPGPRELSPAAEAAQGLGVLAFCGEKGRALGRWKNRSRSSHLPAGRLLRERPCARGWEHVASAHPNSVLRSRGAEVGGRTGKENLEWMMNTWRFFLCLRIFQKKGKAERGMGGALFSTRGEWVGSGRPYWRHDQIPGAGHRAMPPLTLLPT